MSETKISPSGDLVRLNVGGVSFVTFRSTVESKAPSSMLARMLASEDPGGVRMAAGRRDAAGALVIDRSPEYFRPVINFLRTGRLVLDEGVNPEGGRGCRLKKQEQQQQFF